MRALVREAGSLELVGEAGTGLAAVALIDVQKPDIVFLDIELRRCPVLKS